MSLRALSIAAAQGGALLRRIDAISGNLACADMPGAHRLPRTGDFKHGILQSTLRDLDIAIEGDGFLRVLLPDGSAAFTRAGSLDRNDQGLLTADGLVLDPPLKVPPSISKLTIDPDGFVQGLDSEAPRTLVPIGQIEVSRFENASGLEPINRALFRASQAAGDRFDGRPGEEFGSIRQGYLESSTINPLRELLDLAHAQRAFELNNRVIQAADEVLQGINNLRRRP